MNTPVSSSVTRSELLVARRINLDPTSTSRDEVLQEPSAHIPELANRPATRQTLLRALVEREQPHSTGIGDGIALPHASNALAGIVDPAIIPRISRLLRNETLRPSLLTSNRPEEIIAAIREAEAKR